MHKLREQMGLTQPFYIQFFRYLRQLLRGDLGFSVISRKPVLTLILERLPATVVLMSTAFVFSALFGGLWGVISAVKARTQVDYWVTSVSLFGYSIPTFWLGLILIFIFSLHHLRYCAGAKPGRRWPQHGRRVRRPGVPAVGLVGARCGGDGS